MGIGLDPNIILAGKQYTGPDPHETARTMAQLAESGLRQDGMRQEMAQGRSLADIYRQNAATPQNLGSSLMRGGFGKEALGVQNQQAEIGARAAATQKTKEQSEREALMFMIQPALDAKTQEDLDGVHALWQRMGVPPEYAAQLPRDIEHAAPIIKQYRAMAIPADKQASLDATSSEAQKKRTFDAEQKDLDRKNHTTNASIMARQKAGDAEEKKAAGNRKRYLEGFDISPDAEPSDVEMKDIRKAQANARTMTQTIDEISGIYKKFGNSPLPGPVKARMSSLSTDLIMAAKSPEMYQLGVIAGPDMELLNRVAADPTTKESTILDFVGDDQSMARLGAFRGQIDRRFGNSARSLGFMPRAKGAQSRPSGAASKPVASKPGAMSPEQRRARIAEIEAELAAEDGK